MSSTGWQIEINRMLAAFSHQGTHSLCVIKAAFRQSGLSFTPQFKQHFLQVSINRIKETYEQFELNSVFEDQMKASLNESVSTIAWDEAGRDSMPIQPSDHSNDEDFNQLNTVVHVSTLSTEETMGESEVNSEPNDNISGDKSNASSANTFESVIEINDSDEEEADVEPEMEPADETTSGHTSILNEISTNESENGHILIVNPSTPSAIDSNACLVVAGESGFNQMLLQNDESNGSKSHDNLGANLNKSSVLTTGASNKPTGNVHNQNDLANVGSVEHLDTSTFTHSNAYNKTRPPKRKSSLKFIALSQAKVRNMSRDSHDVNWTNESETSGQIKNGKSRVNGDTKTKDSVEPMEEEMNGQPRLKSCLVEGTRLKKKTKKKSVCFIGVPPPTEKVIRIIRPHKTPLKVRVRKHTIDTNHM